MTISISSPARMLSVLAVTLAVTLAALAGCRRTEPPPGVPPETLEVLPGITLRTDDVGEARDGRATFVLADARNLSDTDAVVTLSGTLRDAAGADVGRLRPESLRIPAGGRRTFALVDAAAAERPTAVTATLEAHGFVPRDAPSIVLSEPHVFDDRGKVVVAARITNTATRGGAAVVLAGFHDAAGRPMTRPFDVLQLAAGGTTVVRFVGPEGSATGYVFIGDVVY